MTQLNQLVAIERDVKVHASTTLTDAHHAFQRSEPLTGIARTYSPKDDNGDKYPDESTLVQLRADDVIGRLTTTLTRWFDLTVTKDTANMKATGTVRLPDGTVLIEDCPATFLLFLEKKLVDINTFIGKLPVLSPNQKWHYDQATDSYASDPKQTVKTKKVPKAFVKAEATDKHPAQVDVFQEDIVLGTWTTTDYSGALPASRVSELQERVTTLLEAVRFAREEANQTVITDVKVGAKVLDYLFAPSAQ